MPCSRPVDTRPPWPKAGLAGQARRPGRRDPRALCLRAAAAAGLLLAPIAGLQAQTLTLHFQERPPFSSLGADGQPQGLLVQPLTRAMTRAGIAHRWASTPGQRQLALIQQGDGLDCGIGWFRTPEREVLGLFSRPIYRDGPFQALVRQDSLAAGEAAVADLLADPALPLLAKAGYSYGPLIDPQLEAHAGAVRRTSAESLSMARMIVARRAGWMLISPEEYEVLQAGLGPDRSQLKLLRLTGIAAGPARHLYCNRSVGAALLVRVDRALAEP